MNVFYYILMNIGRTLMNPLVISDSTLILLRTRQWSSCTPL